MSEWRQRNAGRYFLRNIGEKKKGLARTAKRSGGGGGDFPMGNRISEKRKKELYIIYLYKLPYTIEPVKDLSVNHIRQSPRFPTSQKKRSFEHHPDSLFHFQIITHTHTQTDSWTHRFFLLAHAWIHVFLISWKEEAQRPTDRWAPYFLTREDFQQFDSHFQLNRLCSDFPSLKKKILNRERERYVYNYIRPGGKIKGTRGINTSWGTTWATRIFSLSERRWCLSSFGL